MVILKRYLQQPAVPITVALLGAGGTGSMMLTHLARINSTLNATSERMLRVKVIDGDIVTEANMGRQMFAPCDLGRSKAEVLVERINRFYGIDWEWEQRTGIEKDTYCNIIITCTDNKASRLQISQWLANPIEHELNSMRNYFWIDCGNGQYNGNVVVGSHVYGWPDVTKQPAWTDQEDTDTPSCSIAEAISKQDLFINSWMANIAGTWLWQFLHNKKIDWRGAFLDIESMRLRKIPVNGTEIQVHKDGLRGDSNKGRAKARKKAPQA